MSTDHQVGFTDENVSRGLALWEIISVITSGLIAEWAILTFAGQAKLVGLIPIFLGIGLMLFSHRVRGESARDIGFRLDNFLEAVRLLALPTLVAVVLLMVLSWQLSSNGFSLRPIRARMIVVPLWALFQQYGLQGFLNRRAQILFGPGLKSALLVAIAFSILHFPSPLLVILTFVGGFVWALTYQRQPNLFALALSHTIVSLTLSITMPPNLTHLLRVGFKYFG